MLRNQVKTPYASKGQKMIAALFLATRHLPEHDPMRAEIRELAVELIGDDELFVREVIDRLVILVGAASMAGLIGERNAAIIDSELKYFFPSSHGDAEIAALFPPAAPAAIEPKGHDHHIKDNTQMSFIPKPTSRTVVKKAKTSNGDREKRQERIVSYINDRKSANIKDISSLFPDVSEKTIQRELGLLVSSGKIRKHGNKRWSLYLPV